jgi:hypothetical protein
LQAGTSRTTSFTRSYVVPKDDYYGVTVYAELGCDAYKMDNKHSIMECVDRNDIRVIRITKPDDPYDNVGASINLAVEIRNESQSIPYDNVVVHAEILDGDSRLDLISETINRLYLDSTMNYVFAKPYTVPALFNYTIKVYIDKRDINPFNDTITTIRNTNNKTIDYNAKGFALGQNIPNPAKDNTRIDYSIPNDGQVIFTVYTITGQTLHIENQDANSGKNSIEFNTINLANGIYYYSMEYKGERLVKKMTIRK